MKSWIAGLVIAAVGGTAAYFLVPRFLQSNQGQYDVYAPNGFLSDKGVASLTTAKADADALGSGSRVVDIATGAILYTSP